MQKSITPNQLDPTVAVRRSVVNWAFNGSQDFGSGTVPIGILPIGIGESILSVFPPNDQSNGIFVVTAINVGPNTATVVPRADSVTGSRFSRNEEVFVREENTTYVLNTVEDGAGSLAQGVIGTVDLNLSWIPQSDFITKEPMLMDQSYGEKSIGLGAGSYTINPDIGVIFADATLGNVTLQLTEPQGLYTNSNNDRFVKRYTIVRTDNVGANSVFVGVPGTIDGVSGNPQATIAPLARLTLVNNLANWYSV